MELSQIAVGTLEGTLKGALRVDALATRYAHELRAGSSKAGRLLPKFGSSVFDDAVERLGLRRVSGIARRAVPAAEFILRTTAGGEDIDDAAVKTAIGVGAVAGGAKLGTVVGCAFTPLGCVVGGAAGAALGAIGSVLLETSLPDIDLWPF